MNVLTTKDHLGRRILVLNQGQVWNPDEITTDQIFQLLYLSKCERKLPYWRLGKFEFELIIDGNLPVHIIAQLEKSTQINGVVVIMDFEGLSLTQIKGLKSGSTKRLLTFIQEAMPLRLKEVHFVKQPFIFNMVWALIKPFVKEKLKNRVRKILF